MPKIVILDGHVANSGDLSWQALEEIGDLTVYPRTSPDEVLVRAADAEIIFTNKVEITADILENLPKLRFVGVLATGFNNVDVRAARRHGVTVCNVPAYSTDSVVQTIFAHLLNITSRVALHADAVRNGAWEHCRDFSFRLAPVTEIAGLTMGIYGLGHIGAKVAKIAHAFGMKVISLTSKVPWQLPEYITAVEKDQLFKESDVLVLCAPLTSTNKHFVNVETLAMMKPSAILINTARGGLVDSEALARALDDRKIFAAGIDVLEVEPPRHDEPLLHATECHISPHYAWQSETARRRLIEVSAENLKAFLDGNPVNVVN